MEDTHVFWVHLQDRLLDQCLKSPDSDCLVWTGCTTNGNRPHYDRIWVKMPSDETGRSYLAHRVAVMCHLRFALGRNDLVSHLCGHSLCVNASHLTIEPLSTNIDRRTCYQFKKCNGHGPAPDCLFGKNIQKALQQALLYI